MHDTRRVGPCFTLGRQKGAFTYLMFHRLSLDDNYDPDDEAHSASLQAEI